MKYLLLSSLYFFLMFTNHEPEIISVSEFNVVSPNTKNNIFTSKDFSISKSKYKNNYYYILTSKRNDNQEVFQKLFLNTSSFEKISNLNNGEEETVCVYYYKKEVGFREDIKLGSEELVGEIKYIDGVRSQKYFYEYCGTNMFVKKTGDDTLLILINNTYQTPRNWYEKEVDRIELVGDSYNKLVELINHN